MFSFFISPSLFVQLFWYSSGASELAVPSTKACHTHGSAGVGRGGCFAGTSRGISPGITLGISPFSRCRQLGTPENQKIRGGLHGIRRFRRKRRLRSFQRFRRQEYFQKTGASRKSQRLRDSRSSEGFMNFAAQGASVTSEDFTASGVHTDSDAAGNLMGLPLGGLPGACGFRGFLNFRRLSSLRRPHGIRGHRRLRGLGRSR